MSASTAARRPPPRPRRRLRPEPRSPGARVAVPAWGSPSAGWAGSPLAGRRLLGFAVAAPAAAPPGGPGGRGRLAGALALGAAGGRRLDGRVAGGAAAGPGRPGAGLVGRGGGGPGRPGGLVGRRRRCRRRPRPAGSAVAGSRPRALAAARRRRRARVLAEPPAAVALVLRGAGSRRGRVAGAGLGRPGRGPPGHRARWVRPRAPGRGRPPRRRRGRSRPSRRRGRRVAGPSPPAGRGRPPAPTRPGGRASPAGAASASPAGAASVRLGRSGLVAGRPPGLRCVAARRRRGPRPAAAGVPDAGGGHGGRVVAGRRGGRRRAAGERRGRGARPWSRGTGAAARARGPGAERPGCRPGPAPPGAGPPGTTRPRADDAAGPGWARHWPERHPSGGRWWWVVVGCRGGDVGTVDWSRASSTRASSGEAIDAPLSSSDGRHGRPQTFCAREERRLPRHRWNGRERGPALPLRASPWLAARWPGTTRCPGNSRKQHERRRAAPPDGMAQDCQRVCQNRQAPAKIRSHLPVPTGSGACGRSPGGRWPGTWRPGRSRRRRRRAGGCR